ncbi:hypothetical protein F7P73_13500 [Acinetobacter bohemicus]|uniref:Uncharacterized protein n=1 Tax=Acinetobacter bohemicus TaxID=1435036 RepID=A0A1I6VEK6_9GAMM|nr:hypothetical protein F7P73_13500 [Acinetobacter bohemicus]SFT12178.1 hypothetical protein SAMN05444586_10254 [Acinetobacter bohemicus]
MGNDLAKVPAANAPVAVQPERMNADPFWGTVSKHKFAEFNICTVSRDENNNEVITVDSNQPTVRAFLVDGDKTMESQWQTPFENSNPELKMPMLMAGLQTGQTMISMGAAAPAILGETALAVTKSAMQPIADFVKSVQGHTNLNKVNTTQVFLSTASVRLNLSLFFIALSDAKIEVEEKIMQLESWAVPAKLSQGTVLTDVIEQGVAGLFSGIIPPYISLTTHGKTYWPFILESVSAPIVTPIDEHGNRLNLAVNLSLMSRTAWDAEDVRKLYGS